MSDTHDRDATTDRLLRQGLQPDDGLPATDACLDAEMAAAWIDGGLPDAERTRIETHLADCARCQAVVGTIARTAPAAATAGDAASSPRWLGWLIPVAAAAVVVVAVLVIPDRQVLEAPEQAAQAPAIAQEGARSELAPERERDAASLDRADVARGNEAATPPATAAAPPVQAQAPPPPTEPVGRAQARQVVPAAALEERLSDLAALDVASPDAAVSWRVRGQVVERTTDAGATWVISNAELPVAPVAGAAPSATACWLVGPGGAVLLTTDGATWRRLAFPEPVDLTAVEATDGRTATVTTADGRRFRTTDGGATWSGAALQGI